MLILYNPSLYTTQCKKKQCHTFVLPRSDESWRSAWLFERPVPPLRPGTLRRFWPTGIPGSIRFPTKTIKKRTFRENPWSKSPCANPKITFFMIFILKKLEGMAVALTNTYTERICSANMHIFEITLMIEKCIDHLKLMSHFYRSLVPCANAFFMYWFDIHIFFTSNMCQRIIFLCKNLSFLNISFFNLLL